MKPPRDLAATALLAVFTAPLSGAGTETVVVLPFTNLSGVERAPSEIAASFCRRIARKGYSTAPADEVEAFLAAERVRYLDSLSGRVREKLLSKFGASAVIFGTVYSFAEGENAIVGLSARMLRTDGGVAWAGVAALSGEETEGLLGLGRVSSTAAIAEKAVERLLGNFPAAGRIVWTSRLSRSGRDYEGLLELGAISNIVTLADQVAAEMVRAADNAKGRGRRPVTASATASNKTYDGSATATITSCTLSGVLAGDSANVSCSAASASFSDTNAGDGKAVTASGIALSGNTSGNYALSSTTATTTANINRKPVTASVTASNKTYEGTNSASIASCTLSGVLAGDSANVGCSAANASFSDANAGTGKTVTASRITLSGNASGNYVLRTDRGDCLGYGLFLLPIRQQRIFTLVPDTTLCRAWRATALCSPGPA